MEFTIDRNELMTALYLTQGIVDRRTTIPILGNVLIQSVDDGVCVTATDQEVAVERRCTAAVKRKGSLTTPARKLYEMVREFPEGEVRFHSLENNWIEVACGRSRFRLVGMDPREFPAVPQPVEGSAAESLRVPASALADMIERTVFAVSGDETRVNLHGIYLEGVDGERLRLVATDGHRLAMITRPVEGTAPAKGVILSRKAVQELRKALEEDGEPVEFSVRGGMAHATRGPVRMSMRLVEGEFPDYHQVIPAKSERTASIEVGAFLAALRRVSLVSSERTHGVKLQFETNRLELSSINPDIGEAAEEAECQFEGDMLSIGFNARYLIEALSLFPPDGRLDIGLNDDVSPGVVRLSSDPDYCYIVMPMRL